MASINGISAKGITKFLGHEEEPCYQGNLYLNNKKIGYWSQDSMGGEDHFQFDPKCSKRKLNEKIKTLNPDKAWHGGTPEHPFVMEYDLDLLLHDFIVLWLDEKEFKKAVKAGYGGVLVATDGFHVTTWYLPKSYAALPDEKLFAKLAKEIAVAKNGFFEEDDHTKHVLKVYRTPADFAVGEPILFEDIVEKR